MIRLGKISERIPVSGHQISKRSAYSPVLQEGTTVKCL